MLSINLQVSPQNSRFSDLDLLVIGHLGLRGFHGGHVGGQELKHFSPLGNKPYFHVNSSREKIYRFDPQHGRLSRGCKPRISAYTFKTKYM